MEIIDFRKSNFVMLPTSLVKDQSLKPSDKLIYATLCLFTNNHSKSSYPSVDTIAESAACNRISVYRSLKVLEENGYIKRENRYGSKQEQLSNRYYLLDV